MSVKTPMYDNIEQSNWERRQQVKAKAVEITQQNQNPFSFYDKDVENLKNKKETKPLVDEECKHKFKAKGLPSIYAQADSIKVQQMEEERKRLERKEARKKEMAEKSMLPPGMQADVEKKPQRLEKIEKLKQDIFEKDHKFNPIINKEVPNHKALQEEFEKKLEQNKQTKIKTEPVEFGISKPKQFEIEEIDEGTQMMAVQDAKLLKKKKFGAINTFLERNFLPTEELKVEAQKKMLAKNQDKLTELKKQTENLNKDDKQLSKNVIAPKNIKHIIKGKTTFDMVFNEQGNIQLENGFELELMDGGTQGAAGVKQEPPPPPKKPNLFSVAKPKVEKSVIDSTQVQTKKQKSQIKAFQRKKEEDAKVLEEEKKKKKEEAEKKRKIKERVMFRFAEEAPAQSAPTQNKERDIKNEEAIEYQKNMEKLNQKLEKKDCLIEARSHASKVLQEYRKRLREEGRITAQESVVSDVNNIAGETNDDQSEPLEDINEPYEEDEEVEEVDEEVDEVEES